MEKIIDIIIQMAVVLFAISLHEASHAWSAYKCGDWTAKRMGRVTLNPVAHIDLFGTIIFPGILALIGAPVFGWAKPVMVNPYNMRNPRRDNMLVSAAGPLSNLIAATIGIGLFLGLKHLGTELPLNMESFLFKIFLLTIIINVYLAIFNLIPVPPLDGSGIIEGFLKGNALYQYRKLKPYGFIILIIIIYSNILDLIAVPVTKLIYFILIRG